MECCAAGLQHLTGEVTRSQQVVMTISRCLDILELY